MHILIYIVNSMHTRRPRETSLPIQQVDKVLGIKNTVLIIQCARQFDPSLFPDV